MMLNSSTLRPRTLSNESDSSDSTVTTETVQDWKVANCLSEFRIRHQKKRDTRSVVSSWRSRNEIEGIGRSKTLEDAPRLDGKVRKIDSHCFAMGGYADIWKGLLENGDIVAVKCFRSITEEDEDLRTKLVTRLNREALVWLQLDHPYVMPFLGICYDFNNSNMPSLVSPYCPNRDIVRYLRHTMDPFYTISLLLLAQVSEALRYLHENGVVHGDLKGSNVMIDDQCNAVLTDFGISRMLDTRGFTTKSIAGSCRWMSVELLCDEDQVPSFESDVWSLGMTILEVLTRRPPFDEVRKDSIVLLTIMRGELPMRPATAAVSDSIWDLLSNCWTADPGSRPHSDVIAETLQDLYLISADVEAAYDEDVFTDDEEDDDDECMDLSP